MNAVNEGSVGLLVVHGVGRQKEGESSAKLIEGLSRMDGVEIGTSEDVLRIDGTDVRVFEVYWADLLTGAEIERTFDSRDLQTVAWFPWFNRVRGIYKDGDYRWGTTLLWTFFLPIASFLSWLGLQGAGLLVKLGEAFVRVAREIGAVFDRGRGQSSEPERIKDTKRETKALSWKGALQTAQEAKDEYTTVDSLMDDYAGDVFTYVDSAGEAFKEDKPRQPATGLWKDSRPLQQAVTRCAQEMWPHTDTRSQPRYGRVIPRAIWHEGSLPRWR